MVDVDTVHDRLEPDIGEARVQDVLDGLFAEVVVDAEDRLFAEVRMENTVQLDGRGQISPEGLLDDDARMFGTARVRQPCRDRAEHAGRDRQVVQRALGVAESCAQPAIGGGVAVVAVDIAQLGGEFGESCLIDAPVLFQALAGAGA